MTAAPAFTPDHDPVAPPADPQAIRACLGQLLAADFDREWEFVLDEAKRSQQMAPIHELLHKWRFIAYGEMTDPGQHYRMLATAERTLATGKAPEGSISGDELMARLKTRLGR